MCRQLQTRRPMTSALDRMSQVSAEDRDWCTRQTVEAAREDVSSKEVLCVCTCSTTADTDSHGSTIAHMGVVGLTEQGDDAGALLWHTQQHKAQAQHCSSPHIIRDITDGKVQQLLDGSIVCCATVRHANHKHASIPAQKVNITAMVMSARH